MIDQPIMNKEIAMQLSTIELAALVVAHDGYAPFADYVAIMKSELESRKRSFTKPMEALRHHVTGAIERGEKQAIIEKVKP